MTLATLVTLFTTPLTPVRPFTSSPVRNVLVLMVLSALSASCASAGMGVLSRSKDIAQDAIALKISSTATPDEIAAMIKQQGVEVAILASSHDSAWYADLATRAGMKITRPGKAGATTFAFLGPAALGDTTLTLKVTGGGEIRVHDALYRIDKERRLDLLAVHIDQGTNLTQSVRALLAYVASDVLANAAVIFAVEPPTPALGDSVSVLMRAAFADAWECTKDGKTGARNTDLPLRMFYGPSSRLRCDNAERLNTGGTAVLAHLVLITQ